MSTHSLVLLSIAEIFGDFGLKHFARTGLQSSLAAGSLGYVGVVYFLIQALKSGNVLYVNGMWDGMSALLESVAAYIILGERLNTPTQYVGLASIIIGLYMLSNGGIAK